MPVLAPDYFRAIKAAELIKAAGRICAINGMVIEAIGCEAHLGELVEVVPARGGKSIRAEVVGLRADRVLLMPFDSVDGLCLNSTVIPTGHSHRIPIGPSLLGRVIDPTGRVLDDLEPLKTTQHVKILGEGINPLHRVPITKNLLTHVKAVDSFTPLGRGQRMGIFAGSGVGKSTLLGMMARNAEADVIVIALIGERGREVGDFIRENLGDDGLKRAVVVVASADQPAVIRRLAAFTATAIAESFRSKGKQVLLIMDSITRFAMAQREIGLAIGEPMGSRGYPPSVFALLPPLLERAGALKAQGGITALYTVLVEGDDMNDPVADHMRAILDGHIVLTRELANRGQFPAIDILQSISRLNNQLTTAEQRNKVERIKTLIASYSASKELIELGAYERGSNEQIDRAIRMKADIDEFLAQKPDADISAEAIVKALDQLFAKTERA